VVYLGLEVYRAPEDGLAIMSGRWFRLYDELLNDPKVQNLPPWAFKMLVNLWCLASKNGGTIPEEGLPYALRMRRDHVANGLLMLFSCGLLERVDSSLVPHKWDVRNPNHKPSTERTRAYRERERSRERAGTPLEVEVEVEVDKIDSSGAKAPTPTKRAHRLPEDWQPRREDFDKLCSEGFSLSEIQDQLVRFRDYWRGNGRAMVDWFATFRNWVRKSAEIGQGRGGPRAQSPPKRNVFMDLGTEALNKFEERENAEQVTGYIEDRRTQERG
jgi:hypothetical protein